MGLYPIQCTTCSTEFMWFSGTLDQRCQNCRDKEAQNKDQLIERLLDVLAKNAEAMDRLTREVSELKARIPDPVGDRQRAIEKLLRSAGGGIAGGNPLHVPYVPGGLGGISPSPGQSITITGCIHEYPDAYVGNPCCIRCGLMRVGLNLTNGTSLVDVNNAIITDSSGRLLVNDSNT